MSIHVGRQLAAAFALAALATATTQLHAACKGQPQNACTADTSCAWVNGYERRDGIEVAGYCRTRSGNKATAPQPGAAATGEQG